MQMGRTKATQSFWSIIRVVTVIMFVATRELPSVVGAAADSGKGGHELQGGGGAVGVGGVGTTMSMWSLISVVVARLQTKLGLDAAPSSNR